VAGAGREDGSEGKEQLGACLSAECKRQLLDGHEVALEL